MELKLVLAQQDAGGSYWLSRLKLSTAILTRDRQRIDIGQMLSKHAGNAIDIPILLGAKALLPVRLLAQRVPDEVANQRRRRIRQQARRKGQTPSARKLAIADWTLLVTNASTELLSLSEAMVLLRVRWLLNCCSNCSRATPKSIPGKVRNHGVSYVKFTPNWWWF